MYHTTAVCTHNGPKIYIMNSQYHEYDIAVSVSHFCTLIPVTPVLLYSIPKYSRRSAYHRRQTIFLQQVILKIREKWGELVNSEFHSTYHIPDVLLYFFLVHSISVFVL